MPIDIGPGATNRASQISSDTTYIVLSNPANKDGIIDTIELWFGSDATNVKVGTFYADGAAGYYACRDSVSLGSITSGSKQTKTGLSLSVEAGDLIGVYDADGAIKRDSSGGGGLYYDNASYFSGTHNYRYYSADYEISIYGTGVGVYIGECSISAVSAVSCVPSRVRGVAVLITAAGTLTYAGLAFATKRLIYSGTLESGDVLVIDTDEMTVKLNGVNVTMYFTGDFFELFVGDSEIEYFDHEGSRTALVSIDHSDKWI